MIELDSEDRRRFTHILTTAPIHSRVLAELLEYLRFHNVPDRDLDDLVGHIVEIGCVSGVRVGEVARLMLTYAPTDKEAING